MNRRAYLLLTFIMIFVTAAPGFTAGIREFQGTGTAPEKPEATGVPAESGTALRPVYIAYGIAYQNVDFLMGSLLEIQKALLRDGVPSFITGKEAFASIEDNARIMKDEILQYLAEHPGYRKVDIIAHSKGGLEARYMIARLGMGEYVASLTTIASPHRGSPVADFLVEAAGEGGQAIATAVANAVGALLGDSNPESDSAVLQLTPFYLEAFNEMTPDHPDVYYLSYASQLGERYPGFLYRTIGNVIYEAAGPNDGLVPVTSAVWGEFGGLVCMLYGHKGLSHSDLIGGNPFSRNEDFDYIRFFRDIVKKVQP